MGEIHASELRALQTAHIERSQVLAAIHYQVVERCLCASATDIECGECREVAQVECLQDSVTDICQVKAHDA